MERIKLNQHAMIPVIGSGTNTFGKTDRNYMGDINFDTHEIESAIQNGYRHFDTAIAYRNEAVLALGIKRSGVDRKEIFITSKIPGKPEFYENEDAVRQGVRSSLEALDTDYIDLYLIHHPWDDLEAMLAMWRVLESYVDRGILKAIGVSNFNEEQLEFIVKHGRIKPSVNQIESHPGKWHHNLVSFCMEQGIVVEAWGPLSRVSETARKVLSDLGQPYGKTWAQVALRYQVQRGVVVIPKSHDQMRQAQNLDLFDFSLSPEAMFIVSQL